MFKNSPACCLIFLFALCSYWTFAGGYQVNLQGVKQTGMGHTGVSLYQGPSNLFFNPGSIGLGDAKIAFAAGVSLIDARVVHYNETLDRSYRNKSGLGNPVSAYYTHKISKNFTAGVALFTPFGSSLEYEDNWIGRYVLTDISLGTVYLQPTIAYQYGPVGVGVGLMLGSGWLQYGQDIPLSDNDGNISHVELEAKGKSLGFNLGLFIELTEGLNFGISYRSGHAYKVDDGQVTFTVPASAREQLNDQEFTAKLRVPANTMVGITYEATERLRVSGEVNFTFWSVYRNLEIDFKENTETLKDINEPRRWRDSEAFRFGLEYMIKPYLTARAGFSKDYSPVNIEYYGPETPDSDRRGYHLGASININKKLKVDLAFQWAEGEQVNTLHRPSGLQGVYKGRAFVYGGGLSYEF